MYENGKTYSGTFAGVKVTFSLQNFSEKVVETFNQALVTEVMKREIDDIRPVGVVRS